MRGISRTIEALPQSGIRAIMDLAAGLEGVIHLEVGEPSFNTLAHIIDAAFADAHDGHTKYTSNAGLPSLRGVIAAHYAKAWDRPIGPEHVLVTAGCVNALAAAILTLAEDGDEVLLPDPGWPNYASIVALSRARAIPYTLRPERGYLPDRDEIASRMTRSPGHATARWSPIGATDLGSGVCMRGRSQHAAATSGANGWVRIGLEDTLYEPTGERTADNEARAQPTIPAPTSAERQGLSNHWQSARQYACNTLRRVSERGQDARNDRETPDGPEN